MSRSEREKGKVKIPKVGGETRGNERDEVESVCVVWATVCFYGQGSETKESENEVERGSERKERASRGTFRTVTSEAGEKLLAHAPYCTVKLLPVGSGWCILGRSGGSRGQRE